MGTIQRNSDWEQRTSVKKGNIGEHIVQRFLESKGFVCYQAVTERAHSFDFLAIKDKEQAIVAEVKTKAAMTHYKATGINESQFQTYAKFLNKHHMKAFLFFVDENKREIYGNWLHLLNKPATYDGREYPYFLTTRYGDQLRLFPLEHTIPIARLDDETAETLKGLSRRNYEYRQEARPPHLSG